MTKKEAKARTLKVWRYLAKHPEIELKEELPDRLYNQIKDFKDDCPLYELFNSWAAETNFCEGCPLAAKDAICLTRTYSSDGSIKTCKINYSSPYGRWFKSKSKDARAKAAVDLVAIVKGWKV